MMVAQWNYEAFAQEGCCTPVACRRLRLSPRGAGHGLGVPVRIRQTPHACDGAGACNGSGDAGHGSEPGSGQGGLQGGGNSTETTGINSSMSCSIFPPFSIILLSLPPLFNQCSCLLHPDLLQTFLKTLVAGSLQGSEQMKIPLSFILETVLTTDEKCLRALIFYKTVLEIVTPFRFSTKEVCSTPLRRS